MRSFFVNNVVKNSAIALFSLTLAAGVAAAQAPAPLKIGILQAQAALESTKDGQAAKVELDKKLGPKAADLQKRENDLRDLQDKITRGGNTLSQAAKDELTNTFTQKKKTYDRDYQDFNDEVQAADAKVLGDLSEKLKKVIDKFRQDNGFALILDVSNPNTPVVSFSDEIDVTQAIIEAYDKTAPTPAKSVMTTPRPGTTPAPSATKPPASVAAPPPKAPAPAPAK
jgi:outer membrane protein